MSASQKHRSRIARQSETPGAECRWQSPGNARLPPAGTKKSGVVAVSFKIRFAVVSYFVITSLHAEDVSLVDELRESTVHLVSRFVYVDCNDYRRQDYTRVRQKLKDSVVNGQLHPPRRLTGRSHFRRLYTSVNLSGSNNELMWLATCIHVKIYYPVSLIHVLQTDAALRRDCLPRLKNECGTPETSREAASVRRLTVLDHEGSRQHKRPARTDAPTLRQRLLDFADDLDRVERRAVRHLVSIHQTHLTEYIHE